MTRRPLPDLSPALDDLLAAQGVLRQPAIVLIHPNDLGDFTPWRPRAAAQYAPHVPTSLHGLEIESDYRIRPGRWLTVDAADVRVYRHLREFLGFTPTEALVAVSPPASRPAQDGAPMTPSLPPGAPLVYLAGQIAGLEYLGATDWRDHAQAALYRRGIQALSPMRDKPFLKNAGVLGGTYAHPLATAGGITTRDRMDVQRCDLLLMYLPDDEVVSKGTMIELGWADAWGKPVVLVTPPDSGYARHAMVSHLAPIQATTLEDGLELACSLLGAGAQAPLPARRAASL